MYKQRNFELVVIVISVCLGAALVSVAALSSMTQTAYGTAACTQQEDVKHFKDRVKNNPSEYYSEENLEACEDQYECFKDAQKGKVDAITCPNQPS